MGVQGALIGAILLGLLACDGQQPVLAVDAGCVATPAWVRGVGAGTWVELSGTSLRSVDPVPRRPGGVGPLAKVIGWSSFVVDEATSRVLTVATGGHSDYAGNEVDALALEDDVPRWVELRPATPEAQLSPCADHNLDGSPVSRETFYGVTLNARDGRVMLFGGVPYCGNGAATSSVDSYELGSGAFSVAGTHPPMPVVGFTMGIAREPSTDDVYLFTAGAAHRWARETNTWATLAARGDFCGADMMSAFDGTRGHALLAGGRVPACPAARFRLDTQSFEAVTFTGSHGASLAIDKGAMVFEPALDRFLVRRAAPGPEVLQVDPTSMAVSLLPTSGGEAIAATTNGPYNKFLRVPRLGGVVYVPLYEGNAWFLKLRDEPSCMAAEPYVFRPVPSCGAGPSLGPLVVAVLALVLRLKGPSRAS